MLRDGDTARPLLFLAQTEFMLGGGPQLIKVEFAGVPTLDAFFPGAFQNSEAFSFPRSTHSSSLRASRTTSVAEAYFPDLTLALMKSSISRVNEIETFIELPNHDLHYWPLKKGRHLMFCPRISRRPASLLTNFHIFLYHSTALASAAWWRGFLGEEDALQDDPDGKKRLAS